MLDDEHFGLDVVKKRILDFIAVSQLKGSVQRAEGAQEDLHRGHTWQGCAGSREDEVRESSHPR